MHGRGWRWTAALWCAALLVGLGAGQARSTGADPAPAGDGAADGAAAAAVVAAAESALANLDGQKLAAPFGGAVPVWARDWAERRGHDDLFERKWHAHAIRLPAPYHGA
jgi:hypothetical protein